MTSQPRMPLVGWWMVICASCSCAGWGLSALHQLNARGYAVVVTVGLVALIFASRRASKLREHSLKDRCNWGKYKRRFKHVFPLGFAILAALAIFGGILHAPNNFDGLAYRTPRVLHWLAEGRWHWIHTEFQRLNTRASAFEWMTAPVLALARTDRFLFLINAASFLLMPGLVFGVFRYLGMKGRVAWHWMWILPSGYCYLLQAGSIGNDLFGAVFPLAAIYFALRARKSSSVRDVWLSILAAALMTGSKPTNLPLLLPWLVAIAPSLKWLWRKIPCSLAIGCLAATASFLPQAWMNLRYCGDWAGLAAENTQGFTHSPALRIANNAVVLTIQNLAPPVMPFAKAWNRMVARKMPEALREKLEQSFEPAGAHWELGEMEIEESAGAGLGISALVITTLVAGILQRRRGASASAPSKVDVFSKAILLGVAVALGAFMAKSGLSTVARILTPYYGLIVPGLLLLTDVPARLVTAVWWRRLALAVFLMAAVLVILSPARPLWPANTVLSRVAARPGLLARARTVYSVYAQRSDAFAPARKLLQPAPVLGIVTFDDPETSLWRPFFHRRIVHVTATDSREVLRDRGIEYVFVNGKKFPSLIKRQFDEWVAAMHGTIAGRVMLSLRASEEPEDWILVRLASVDDK